MAHRLSSRLTSLLRHRTTTTTLHRYVTTSAATLHPLFPTTTTLLHRHVTTSTTTLHHLLPSFSARFLSTRARPTRPTRPDIGARARQLQTRRLWTYALTFSCIAGFIVIVINQFQDQLVFYITPSEALEKYNLNPSKSKFRLGGLVKEHSVAHIPSSPEMEFVITDLLTDMLVKYEGSLPDLFREGHSVVVEGFVREYSDAMREREEGLLGSRSLEVTGKARSSGIYFDAIEVLAKHDEKYMPKEVAVALERNRKIVAKEEEERIGAAAGDGVVA